MKRLTGKTALITGAAQGIGRGIAYAFAAEGARVVVSDLNADGVARLAGEIGGVAVRLDVRSEADWTDAFNVHPDINVLVNNAGITGFDDPAPGLHDPENIALDAWRAVMATNLDSVMLGCRQALKAMRGRRGAIINIASRSGKVGIPRASAYAASKAAVINHTRTVALYAAEEGLDITCNAISPAAILTPIWEPMLGEGAAREANMAAIVADTPLQRFGTAEEVAALAVLLASDEARYMTGAELTLDGGLLAGSAARPNPD